jgi:hypothetical protein
VIYLRNEESNKNCIIYYKLFGDSLGSFGFNNEYYPGYIRKRGWSDYVLNIYIFNRCNYVFSESKVGEIKICHY